LAAGIAGMLVPQLTLLPRHDMGGVCSGSRAWTKVRGCVLGQIVSDVPEMGQGSAQA
jgi:hypothetical protein